LGPDAFREFRQDRGHLTRAAVMGVLRHLTGDYRGCNELRYQRREVSKGMKT
jgi:hypothetical protein